MIFFVLELKKCFRWIPLYNPCDFYGIYMCYLCTKTHIGNNFDSNKRKKQSENISNSNSIKESFDVKYQQFRVCPLERRLINYKKFLLKYFLLKMWFKSYHKFI